MRLLLVLCSIAMLTACSQKYALDAYHPPEKRIPAQSAIYVITPENGRYGDITYPASGQQTAQSIIAALSPITNKVAASRMPENLETALATARSQGFAYVFQPLILNWEDRATEWSGIPDRITIKLTIYDALNGKDITSMTSRASSKWGTFGGDHPQDLLPKVMNEFNQLIF